jgi:RimJ/RimL family protein N-acetyltransferase
MIIGKRIQQRALEIEDFPIYVRWLDDPEVIQGLLLNLPLSLAQKENWFDTASKGSADKIPLAIEAYTDEGWLHIGGISLQKYNECDRHDEVGIAVGEKRFRNQGYGTEGITLRLRNVFNTQNINRIYQHVYENYKRGIKSYERAGFVHEGRLYQRRFEEGKFIDILLMGIFRSEWIEMEV